MALEYEREGGQKNLKFCFLKVSYLLCKKN